MQAIAGQLKGFVNEVVYVFPDKDALFLKYYSSECPLDFCGHGTIAVMYDLVKTNPALVGQAVIRIRVKDEVLPVFNETATDDSVYIMAPAPSERTYNTPAAELAEALGIEGSLIDTASPHSLINAGLTTLIVPVKGLKACLEAKPDRNILRTFCHDYNIDIVLIFTEEVAAAAHDYRTRVFAPKYGYLEDPATGSGNAAFGYYLMKKNLWDGGKLTIEQSHSAENPNIIRLKTQEHEGQKRVLFGGRATVRILGEYFLE
jgi:PhzF family phenazine biosynthesis protein